jgi:tripartite motif-containing protein 71
VSTRRNVACPEGHGICVSGPHGLVVVSDCNAKQLFMYSLIDGTLIRSTGSKGSGKGQFDFRNGGLCVSPDGDSVLVAEFHNRRVQEVRIVDGSWVRFIGIGVLKKPEYVDCNADVIAVSETTKNRIRVLSWADGSARARLGSHGSGPGKVKWPCGVRLLADNSGVVVADFWNDRLCVFTLSGELAAAVGNSDQESQYQRDVLECSTDGSYIAANFNHSLVKFSQAGVKTGVFGKEGDGNGEFNFPSALAALSNDGCLVVDSGNRRVQYLAHLRSRLAWMRACSRRTT